MLLAAGLLEAVAAAGLLLEVEAAGLEAAAAGLLDALAAGLDELAAAGLLLEVEAAGLASFFCSALGSAFWTGCCEGVPTVDLPTKMAPASIEMVAALMSPTSSASFLSSTRSVTVIFPYTLP